MYTKSHNMLTLLKNMDASQISSFKQHLDSFLSVTKAIGSISRLDELLNRIVHYALTATGAERGFLFLYNQNNETIKLKVMFGFNENLPVEGFSFETYRVSREIIRIVEKTGKNIIGSHEASHRAQVFSDLKYYGIKQALCVPFQSRRKLLGLLYLDHSFDRELFREQESELIKSFAILASLSIENAYLTRKLGKRLHKNISITIEPSPSIPDLIIISIKGILDSITMKHVDEKILPIIENEASDIIIDLSNIDYASKTGIMCLMKYLLFTVNKKRVLKFLKPPKHVYKTLEIVGLARKFEMYDNIETAIGIV